MEPPPPRSVRAERSFTLVEILVAMAVLSLLLVILFSVTGQIHKAMLMGMADSERRSNDRSLLDFIATELQLAVVAPAASMADVIPVATTPDPTNSLNLVINPSGFSGLDAQSIFWQAPIATDRTAGNLAEVGYSVAWSTNRACLRRFFVNPTDTAHFLVYSQPQAWITDGIFQAVAPADAIHNYQGLFAENVFALWVRALDANGNPIVKTAAGQAYAAYAYDSRLGFTDSDGAIHPASSLPPIVEIAVVVADSRTAQRLDRAYPPSPSGSSSNFWADLNAYVATFPSSLAGGIHVYSVRVLLRNAH